MELTRKLAISPEEFFEQVEQSAIEDIERATGKRISPDKLHGFHYAKVVKQDKHTSKMKVKVRCCRPPERYQVRFVYDQGSNTVTYEVEPAEGGCTVRYVEEFETARPTKGIGGMLHRKFYEGQVISKAKQTLSTIEKRAMKARHTS
ncbi:DUF3284 domain-containing protein [Collinsella sp. An2]|uniref:DUF3284 domain-containing protein n=1 Tax=Collinsella sp. An2 TaxID=1965585 RepID=UPI00130272F0|nr:DUF3284 domain-containing protein [Collinsella sp. An2]